MDGEPGAGMSAKKIDVVDAMPASGNDCAGCHAAPGKYASVASAELLCLRCLSDREGLAAKAESVTVGDPVSPLKMVTQHGRLEHYSPFYIAEADPNHPDYKPENGEYVYEHCDDLDLAGKQGRGWERVRATGIKGPGLTMCLVRKRKADYDAVIKQMDAASAKRLNDVRAEGRSHITRTAKAAGIEARITHDEFTARQAAG